MHQPPSPLDTPPATLIEAVDDLARIAGICLKADLPNAGRRCAVIADWLRTQRLQTVDLAALDAELLDLPVGTRIVPPVGGTHGHGSTFEPPVARGPVLAPDAHFNTDTEGLERVKAHLARLGPQRTSDLAPVLHLSRAAAKQKLKRWRKQGLLATVGQQAGSRWALPETAPASADRAPVQKKTSPLPLGDPRPSMDLASARDAAILAQLRRLGDVGAEERDLARHLPDEPEASTLPMTRLAGTLRRLTFKEAIEFREGRYYVLKVA